MSYIPSKDSELALWSANFTSQVATYANVWAIPYNEIIDLQTANADFANLLAKADSPNRTPAIVKEKNVARKTLLDRIHGLVAFRLQNPIITDAQRITLGLHVHDKTPTHIPTPTTRPYFLLKVIATRQLRVIFGDEGSVSRAKPYAVNGAVIFYKVSDTPVEDPEDLTHSVLATRSPYTLTFTAAQSGKRVYIALQWQNERGEKCPWTDIHSIIVPSRRLINQ
jgi:hypothetical protein